MTKQRIVAADYYATELRMLQHMQGGKIEKQTLEMRPGVKVDVSVPFAFEPQDFGGNDLVPIEEQGVRDVETDVRILREMDQRVELIYQDHPKAPMRHYSVPKAAWDVLIAEHGVERPESLSPSGDNGAVSSSDDADFVRVPRKQIEHLLRNLYHHTGPLGHRATLHPQTHLFAKVPDWMLRQWLAGGER